MLLETSVKTSGLQSFAALLNSSTSRWPRKIIVRKNVPSHHGSLDPFPDILCRCPMDITLLAFQNFRGGHDDRLPETQQ